MSAIGVSPSKSPAPASFIVHHPAGSRERILVQEFPFLIGRLNTNNLVLRDNRISRQHARVVAGPGPGNDHILEDLGSLAGTFVNNERIQTKKLRHGDVIAFGFEDSYSLIFCKQDAEWQKVLEQMRPPDLAMTQQSLELAKLRALTEVARAVHSSLHFEEILSKVVDTAIEATGAERGFLILVEGADLKIRVARATGGEPLPPSDLRVPMRMIRRALEERTELLSMNFRPEHEQRMDLGQTVVELELRSVAAVPLIKVRPSSEAGVTSKHSIRANTIGMLYLDSRSGTANLAAGNRELLQTLALEASTILENARLLEEERKKEAMDRELSLARSIQDSLLPKGLPQEGWFQAYGLSLPSLEVAGDYYDVHMLPSGAWSALLADVSGKGVGSALLASFLQGVFLHSGDTVEEMRRLAGRVNQFLVNRTGGEKYATLFYCVIRPDGCIYFINAGHEAPFLVRRNGITKTLQSTSMPVGMLDEVEFEVAEARLEPGDQIVVFSDGLTEARNLQGQYYGRGRIKDLLSQLLGQGSRATITALQKDLQLFAGAAPQADDVTVLAIDYWRG